MIEDVNPVQVAEKWQQELKLAKREDEKWAKRGKKIVRRYRDERQGYSDNAKRYNILWANVQTMLPALYGTTPKAQVARRFKDKDPVARTAGQILERALQYELDHKGDFDHAIKCAVIDRLLPGRGVAWVRFEDEETQTVNGAIEYQCTPCDYVFWEDFRCSPARTWDEVTWVARRVYMGKGEVVKRFGEEYKDVPLTHEPMGMDEMQKNGDNIDGLKKAQVWEIWDKPSKRVYWLAEGYQKALDVRDDPYGLDSFWPCPKPLFATQTTDQLVPIPDYALYQDQAEEIDMLTQRIYSLTKAVKVVGVYDASQTGVQRMLSEGVDNTLIPVESWAAFGEKGGLKGAVDFLPIESVLQALNQCYASREQAKQVVYEITGISDIIRGSSVASETATAQQIKSQYATLRLRDLQKQVAMFASELLRIKAQLMSDFYAPEALVNMSGMADTVDAQYIEPAIQLLKTEPLRSYRIEVASDSLVEIDENTEKQSRMEFLQSAGGFIRDALQAPPQLQPLLGEMLLYGVRSFKAGAGMEGAVQAFLDQSQEQAKMQAQQPPQPTPEQIKEQEDMQRAQMEAQIKQMEMQQTQQLEQMKMQFQQQLEQMKAENALRAEQLKQESETQRLQIKSQIEAETQLRLAEIKREGDIDLEKTKQKETIARTVGDTSEEIRMGVLQQVQEVMEQFSEQLENALENTRGEIIAMTTAPKRIIRGEDGRAIGVEINGMVRELKRGEDGRVIEI
jgi:hypothetical protein